MPAIGFIGSGNMAEALIRGIIGAGVFAPADILVSDVRPERTKELAKLYGVAAASDNADLASRSEIVVLAVKPQTMPDVLAEVGKKLSDKLVISIAAGVTTAKIEAATGPAAIVRAMPNTPALLGKGATGIYANPKARPRLPEVMKIFSAVGFAAVVENESLIDAVTAVSGSGPAYFFLLMEEMVKAAASLGLSEELAMPLVLHTAAGAAALAIERREETPAELRLKVTSPGGTTEAAINSLASADFAKIVEAAIRKAHARSRELST